MPSEYVPLPPKEKAINYFKRVQARLYHYEGALEKVSNPLEIRLARQNVRTAKNALLVAAHELTALGVDPKTVKAEIEPSGPAPVAGDEILTNRVKELEAKLKELNDILNSDEDKREITKLRDDNAGLRLTIRNLKTEAELFDGSLAKVVEERDGWKKRFHGADAALVTATQNLSRRATERDDLQRKYDGLVVAKTSVTDVDVEKLREENRNLRADNIKLMDILSRAVK